MSDPPHVLADHLHHVRGVGQAQAVLRTANDIIADPQPHIDALVAAGVLEVHSVWHYADQYVTRYEVVPPKPPHVHRWKFIQLVNKGGEVSAVWGCACDETRGTSIEPPS